MGVSSQQADTMDTVEKVEKPYYWELMDSDGVLPKHAFGAGKDRSDTFNVFVGLAELDGNHHMGKVHNGRRSWNIEGNHEVDVTGQKFSVLCIEPDAEVEWVKYKKGKFPLGAVVGGKFDGKLHYVGRGEINGTITPGVFLPRKSTFLKAMYGGDLHRLPTFEILVVKKADRPYYWDDMNSEVLPENALAAGKDSSETFNVFLGLGEDNGEYHMGKVPNVRRSIGYGNREVDVTHQKFSVLCVQPDAEVEWEKHEQGILPDGAVIGGRYDGQTHYVGRGVVNDTITPGVFVPGKSACLKVMYGGDHHELDKFEILIVRKDECKLVRVNKKDDQFKVPEGFEMIELDETNFPTYCKQVQTLVEKEIEAGTIKIMRKKREVNKIDKVKAKEIFFEACIRGSFHALEWIVKHQGFDINTRYTQPPTTYPFTGSKHWWKALHLAAANGQDKIIKFLVRAGLDVDTGTIFNNVPLFFSALYGHLSTCKLLVELGADTKNLRGFAAGQTAQDWAREKMNIDGWGKEYTKGYPDKFCENASDKHAEILQFLAQ